LQTIRPKFTFNCGGNILSLEKPVVMGILNLTPDSFYTDSRTLETTNALNKAAIMIEQGAKIIDIGAQSTRPGAAILSAEEELSRLQIVLPELTKAFPAAIFSIDTFYQKTAEFAVKNGVHIINDVSAFELDKSLLPFVVESRVPYVLMHPGSHFNKDLTASNNENLLKDMMDFFLSKLAPLIASGHPDIILDPGFGFGKNLAQNTLLLKNLSSFGIFKMPILAGLSRKSMIRQLTHTDTSDALTGTIAANTIALLNGASILRVHDVLAAVQTIQLVEAMSEV
jgi:dihydropteroate synthase